MAKTLKPDSLIMGAVFIVLAVIVWAVKRGSENG